MTGEQWWQAAMTKLVAVAFTATWTLLSYSAAAGRL